MKTKTLIFILFLAFTGCCKKTDPKNTYNLYLAELFNTDYPISIWINEKLIFNGKFQIGKNSEIPNYMLVDKFEGENKTLIKVSTVYKDTLFYYKTDTIKSLYIWIPYEDFNHFEVKDNNISLRQGEASLD